VVAHGWIRSTTRPEDSVLIAELNEGWELRVFRARSQHQSWFLELDETPAARALPYDVRAKAVVLRDGREIPLEMETTINEVFGHHETPSHVHGRRFWPEDGSRIVDAKEFVFAFDGVERRVPILES
jgi:hypothetical protein